MRYDPEGIGEEVRLSVSVGAGPLLDLPLIDAATLARFAPQGDLLPFLYRERYDPEDPERPRPLRRALLAIVNDEIFPTEPPGTYCACSDPDCPTPEGRFTHGPETPREEAENDRDSS